MSDPISDKIKDTAKYAGLSYAAIALVADEIEAVKDDTERRARLRREFKQEHGLTAQVWAKVPKRFDGAFVTRGEHKGMQLPDFAAAKEKEIRSMGYLCQLSGRDFLDAVSVCAEHLDEHLGVLAHVNNVLDAIQRERTGKPRRARAERKTGELRERCEALIKEWNGKAYEVNTSSEGTIDVSGVEMCVADLRAALDATAKAER